MEVTFVAGRNDQLMNARCGSDHDVFEQVIRLALHEPCRFAEALSIHGQDLERLRQLVNPYFDLRSFRGILAPGAFDTCLEFADGHSGQVNLICLQQFYPCPHSAVRLRFSQLGDHVGVQAGSESPKLHRWATAEHSSFGNQIFKARLRAGEESLEIWAGRHLQAGAIRR
jgi:hypothetical protein